jgi:FkbM family methyltransferase
VKKISYLIKKSINNLGWDIRRQQNNPFYTLLGLRNYPIKTIVDVGANTGQFAHYISGVFPQARLYCFEPLPKPFQLLQSWARHQANGKVTTFNLALGNTESMMDMFYHTEHSPSSSLLAITEVSKTLYPFTQQQTKMLVPVTTLDKAMVEVIGKVEPDLLIKLDVQGYEDRVIQGGIKTFSKAKACILEVCLDKLYEQQASFKDLLLLLESLGFYYVGNLEQIYANDGHVIFVDAIFLKKS